MERTMSKVTSEVGIPLVQVARRSGHTTMSEYCGPYALRGKTFDSLWLPAIPLPLLGIRKRCDCGRKFWTMDGYRAHYALAHILESAA